MNNENIDYDLLMQAFIDKCKECVNLQIVATKLKIQNEELTKEKEKEKEKETND